MANQRALEMASESEDEGEDARVEAATATTANDGSAFTNVPAPGVKPLVVANDEVMAKAKERRTKPKILFDDDDDDDDVMPTQTASQLLRRASPSPRKSPAKRTRTDENDAPASPAIGVLKRTVNAAAEALGFSSPFKTSAPPSPLIGGFRLQSPGAPVMMSPGTMRNVVGSVARSVMDDDDDVRANKVEWGSKSGYEAKAGARRKLALGETSPSKRARR